MNKTWIVAESQSGLCDGIRKTNCHLCGDCEEEDNE